MGNYSSQETTNIVSEFISAVNSTVVNISNSAVATCSGTQTLNITFCPTWYAPRSNFNFNQQFQSNCSVNQDNVNSISASFNNDLKTTIENFTKEQAAQSNGWLATGFNVANEYIANTDELNEQLQNLFNADIKNVCQSTIDALQSTRFEFCGNFQDARFDFTQDIGESAIVSCINQNMIKSLQSNSTLNNFINKTDLAISQQNTGLLDFVTTAIIAFAIVSIFGAFFYYYFSGGQQPEQRRSEGREGYGQRSPYQQRPGEGYGMTRPPYRQTTAFTRRRVE